MSESDVRPGSWFAQEWTELLGNVMESLAGDRPALTCHESHVAIPAGEMLWWEQGFPLPGAPALWIGAPHQTWSQLASRVLGTAGIEEGADATEARATYLEILQQSLGELARGASRRWGHEVVCPAGSEPSMAPSAGEFYEVGAVYPDATLPCLWLAVTGAPADPEPVHAPPPKPGTQSKTFDLLMAVELPVSVSFGRVQIPLKDVLRFTAGSIIELNRQVDEPVEVIVNNCVVARGEVVVVECNYGVRIHQIMSREERLESIP